jgi:hypothetical protein
LSQEIDYLKHKINSLFVKKKQDKQYKGNVAELETVER